MIRKSLFFIGATLIPAALAAAPRTASAQDIVWGVGGALALGSGCSSLAGDTQFIAFGNDAAVLFSKFGLDIVAGGPNTALSQLRDCQVRIPATIKSGLMISQLKQTITYGTNKSANSSGKITTMSTFFGLPVAAFTVNVPFGAINNPSVTQTKVTPFIVNAACSTTATGLYRSDMAVSGSRANGEETLLVSMQGLDLRYDILLTFIPCP